MPASLSFTQIVEVPPNARNTTLHTGALPERSRGASQDIR